MILPKMNVVQYAWVVDSLDSAMEGWLAMGIGPFYTTQFQWDEAKHRGRTAALGIRVAMAQAGAVQLELIEQTTDGDSCYRDVVPAGSTGFHHVCKFTDDVEGEAVALAAAGIAIAGEIPRAGGERTIYADTREQIGCMLEILSPSEQLNAWYALVAESAHDWDGQDPIRELPWPGDAASQQSPSTGTPS